MSLTFGFKLTLLLERYFSVNIIINFVILKKMDELGSQCLLVYFEFHCSRLHNQLWPLSSLRFFHSVVPKPFIGPHTSHSIVFNPLHRFLSLFGSAFCLILHNIKPSVKKNERQGCWKKLPGRLRPIGFLSSLSRWWQGAEYRQAILQM